MENTIVEETTAELRLGGSKGSGSMRGGQDNASDVHIGGASRQ